MNTLAQRFLFGTLLLGGALGLLWLDHSTDKTFGFLSLGLVFGGLAWVELSRLGRLSPGIRNVGLVVVPGALVYGWFLLANGNPWDWPLASILFVPLVLPALVFPLVLRQPPSRERLGEVVFAASGVVYLVLPLISCLWLRSLPHGETWILWMILVVKGNDIGAYLVGRKLGRTPLSPVSPKKTIEGSLGGLSLGLAVGQAFVWIPESPLLPWTWALAAGAAAGVSGQLGDLAESYLKRSCEVKDSGALVPTFGGSLDILDSLLFGGPVVLLVALGVGA